MAPFGTNTASGGWNPTTTTSNTTPFAPSTSSTPWGTGGTKTTATLPWGTAPSQPSGSSAAGPFSSTTGLFGSQNTSQPTTTQPSLFGAPNVGGPITSASGTSAPQAPWYASFDTSTLNETSRFETLPPALQEKIRELNRKIHAEHSGMEAVRMEYAALLQSGKRSSTEPSAQLLPMSKSAANELARPVGEAQGLEQTMSALTTGALSLDSLHANGENLNDQIKELRTKVEHLKQIVDTDAQPRVKNTLDNVPQPCSSHEDDVSLRFISHTLHQMRHHWRTLLRTTQTITRGVTPRPEPPPLHPTHPVPLPGNVLVRAMRTEEELFRKVSKLVTQRHAATHELVHRATQQQQQTQQQMHSSGMGNTNPKSAPQPVFPPLPLPRHRGSGLPTERRPLPSELMASSPRRLVYDPSLSRALPGAPGIPQGGPPGGGFGSRGGSAPLGAASTTGLPSSTSLLGSGSGAPGGLTTTPGSSAFPGAGALPSTPQVKVGTLSASTPVKPSTWSFR